MKRKQIDELIDRYGFKLEETHISWVLIGEQLVYKIKKPVDFGFLDYSTINKRLEFCSKEVELNRRFSKSMYIGVSKITQTEGGIDIDKKGKIIDYAVKMKRIPGNRMMDELIKRNEITKEHIRALSEIAANFHAEAQTNEYISSFGTIKTVKENTDENFKQTKGGIDEYITQYQYEKIEEYTENFYKDNKEMFAERIRDKKIRDCHGDMYSRNICIVSEKEIYIYDCIEFNERFRYSDVASDVAFLLMDLENYGRFDLSDDFLKFYLKYSKDTGMLGILNFYKIYRAYVRGKIAFFQQNKNEANDYFDLAYGYLPDIYKPKLIIMCGLTGSGKSFAAKKIAKGINAAVLSSDETRKKLAGMNRFESDLSDFKKGIYSDDITKKTYEQLNNEAYNLLRNGRNVILDATFLTEKQRNDVKTYMKRLWIEPVVIFIDTDEKTAMEHFKKREREQSASDGRLEIYKEQKKIFEKPEKCIKIHQDANIENLIKNMD